MRNNVHLRINEIQYSGLCFTKEQTKAREVKVSFPRSYSSKERKWKSQGMNLDVSCLEQDHYLCDLE